MRKIIIANGYLARDPESRQVGENTIRTFSLGSDQYHNKEKSTVWTRCKLWGKDALKLEKGMKLAITGELVDETYTNKNNEQVTTQICMVESIAIMQWPKQVTTNIDNPYRGEESDGSPF